MVSAWLRGRAMISLMCPFLLNAGSPDGGAGPSAACSLQHQPHCFAHHGPPPSWHRTEHLRSTSPTASSVISLPRSSVSTASRATGSGVRPGSAGKVDRVKRYQQLQQGWSKDK